MDEMAKIGDVVRLKSGGPKMTIARFTKTDDWPVAVACSWFTGDELKWDLFGVHQLVMAND